MALLSSLWALASVAHGAVEWERKVIELRATPDQTSVVVAFAFTNTGPRPVSILSATTDCDCTTARADRAAYAPGEKGTLSVTFDFGQRIGAQEKRITVRTDEAGAPPVVLRLTVHIPEIVILSPRLVYWKADEAPSPKTIEILIVKDTELKLARAEIDGRDFTVELRSAGERKYELLVTPRAGAAPGMATITLYADRPAERPRTFSAFAKIVR